MKKILAIIAIAAFLSGCASMEKKIQAIVTVVAPMASEGKENAVDGYRQATIKNVGKWRVDFKGLYLDGKILRAQSFDIEGMWTRYEGAPFAWPIE